MPATLDRNGSALRIHLEGWIGIDGAADLKALLVEAVSPDAETAISLGGEVSLDVTAMQLLTAAERAAKASGAVLRLETPWPEELRRTLAEDGFTRLPFSGGEA